MSNYSLNIENKGTFYGEIVIYQKQKNLEQKGSNSVAWMTRTINPGTEATFSWEEIYNFVWGESQNLKTGVIFNENQMIEGSPRIGNKVEFTQNEYGYTFHQSTAPKDIGKLIIEESELIESRKSSVGIGMCGLGTLIWDAEPSTTLKIEAKFEYWLTYGAFQEGEVLDLKEILDKSIKLEYPPHKYNATVAIMADNSWGKIQYR